MHELSQGAGFVRWFEDYGYGYYHADTTPLYIVAVRDYVRASGDAAFAKDFWPSMRKAYDYCASTDEDGDGLMDNTKAGVGAVETGALRRRDVLTDVYLGTVWTEAAGAMRDLARIADPAFAATAAGRGREGARVDQPPVPRQREPPDQLRDHEGRQGPGRADRLAGVRHLARRVRSRRSRASTGMLDQLSRAGLGTDWGVRMLSNESTLYQPLSYNNGATWPFLTGWAALALYHGRAGRVGLAVSRRAGGPHVPRGPRLRDGTAVGRPAAFGGRGGPASALRHDRLRLDRHARDGRPAGNRHTGLRLSPQLPAGWSFLRVKNLRWRDARGTLEMRRARDGSLSYSVTSTKGTLPVELTPILPPASADGSRPRPAAPARQRDRPSHGVARHRSRAGAGAADARRRAAAAAHRRHACRGRRLHGAPAGTEARPDLPRAPRRAVRGDGHRGRTRGGTGRPRQDD